MKKAIPLIIIVLILSILLVSGCIEQAKKDLTNAKQLIDKQFTIPTSTLTPTITPTNTSTPTP